MESHNIDEIKSKTKSNKASKTTDNKSYLIDLCSVEEVENIRLKIRELKEFYTNLLIYGMVCVLSIIVWLSMGAGVFWPIWVILGCGINVGLKAVALGQLPWFEEFFPFLGEKWEEDQFEKGLHEKSYNSVKQESDEF